MKSNWFISIAVVVLALFGFLYVSQQSAENSRQKLVVIESEKPLPISTLEQADEEFERSVKAVKAFSNIASQPQLTDKQPGKKHYDEDWCDAKNELSESDYRFAQTEFNDWLVVIGKARSKSLSGSYFKESAFPNNSLIEPYESLPLEQLQALALQGDKWAMVAFVQHRKASVELKDKVAKKLMVTGASYYALQHFVMNALLEAQVSADKKEGNEIIEGHVTDALAYVYWGLEHYNAGGLNPFMSVAFSERVKAQIPIDSILVNSVDEVNKKIAKLNSWVDEKRVAQGIDMPETPKAFHRFFASRLAAKKSLFEQEFDLLRSLDITNSNRLASNKCVKKNLAEIKERSQ